MRNRHRSLELQSKERFYPARIPTLGASVALWQIFAARFRSRLAITAALLALLTLPLSSSGAQTAEQPAKRKGVLALYWYGKDLQANVILDKSIQAVLQSAPGGPFEYYAEYMDDNRFPGESQALLFRDYLRQKYADKRIDALIAPSSASLNFLLKHRNEIFPDTPIAAHASSRAHLSEPDKTGLAGVVVDSAFRNTFDLALKLHPATEQAFIIASTPERDRKFEEEIRHEASEFESKVRLTYLTDLPLDKLVTRVKNAPKRSIILFVRYSQNAPGGTLNSYDVLPLVAGSARVPVYTIAGSLLGRGSVGGYAANLEDCGTRVAEIALQIVNGARPQDIPVVTVPTVPMFDWAQLRRWGISEGRLPPGSQIHFREQTFWQRYRWLTIGVISFCILETLLIGRLLIGRARRKRTEKALRESEERFSKAFHSSPQPMSVTTLEEGLYLDVNDRFLEVSGYTREEVIGRRSLELNIWESSAARDELTTPLMEGRTVRDWETKFGTKQGEFRVFLSSAELIELGGRHCILVASSDITERKRAEQALRESEERARRALVEQMLAGVIECDTAGKFILVNQRFCEIVGYTEAELLEMQVADLTHEHDSARISELYRLLVETGAGYVTEKRCLHKDGSEVWVHSHVSPIRNAQGAVEKAVAVVIDITERKRAERERERLLKQEKEARAEAQAANQSKDEFLAVVSHELRSPLNSILGYARLLRAGMADTAQIQRTVEIIERNGKMQLRLIEDLLDSARVISGKLELDVKPVSLAGVITTALDVVRPAAQAKGIELISDLEPQSGFITGDPDRLQQVVWNLLSNAIKFTPRQGRVELRMENADHHVRLTVSDTGKGIEPEFLPFVFDRFRQSDSSSARRFGGLGLGLSLARQLVELHGGMVEAASDGPGRGAVFTVTLPQFAAPAESFIPEPHRARPARDVRTEGAIPLHQAPSLAGVRVLAVDDQEEARALLTATLSECGAQVMAVSSGVEALAILADPPDGERPDVLILDIAMPDEDGYQALERVRSLEAERGIEQSAQIPAIALTAHARSEDRMKAFAAGFRMHVAKPVEPAELAVVIASLVERLGVGTNA